MADRLTLGKKKKILKSYKKRNDSIKVCLSDHLVRKILKGEKAYTDKIYVGNFNEFKHNIRKSVLNGKIYRSKGSDNSDFDLRYGSVSFPFELTKDSKGQSDNYGLVLITAIRNPYQERKKLMDSPFKKAKIIISKKQLKMFMD